MASASTWVNGLQSRNVGATLKHFAVNSQETDRMRVSADVDERTLRELYLSAFRRVMTQARPWTVMVAYNKINGVYATQHQWLLTDVARGEWGYDGLFMSDWGAVADRVAAVAAGRLDPALLNQSAERVRALIGKSAARPGGEYDQAAHRALIEEVAKVNPRTVVILYGRATARDDLAYWDIRLNRWVVEGGAYQCAVGASSRDLRSTAVVEVQGDDVRVPLTADSTLGEWLADPRGAQALDAVFDGMAGGNGGGHGQPAAVLMDHGFTPAGMPADRKSVGILRSPSSSICRR